MRCLPTNQRTLHWVQTNTCGIHRKVSGVSQRRHVGHRQVHNRNAAHATAAITDSWNQRSPSRDEPLVACRTAEAITLAVKNRKPQRVIRRYVGWSWLSIAPNVKGSVAGRPRPPEADFKPATQLSIAGVAGQLRAGSQGPLFVGCVESARRTAAEPGRARDGASRRLDTPYFGRMLLAVKVFHGCNQGDRTYRFSTSRARQQAVAGDKKPLPDGRGSLDAIALAFPSPLTLDFRPSPRRAQTELFPLRLHALVAELFVPLGH